MEKKETVHTATASLIVILLISTLIPFVTGSERALVVLSGSMTPLMLVGDLIIVEAISPDELTVGEVIAFKDPGGKDTFVTHRIINIKEGEERVFKTKGDANEEEDLFEVPASDVAGKLVFLIPFAGYLPEASKNKTIFLFTIIIPAAIIILDEIKGAFNYSNPIHARKIECKNKKVSKRTFYSIRIKILAAVILTSGFFFTGVVIDNLGENGPTILQRENTIENSGFLPSVYVLTLKDSGHRLSVEPWYAVIPRNSDTHVTAPESTPATISSVPYILPVFWIILLAELNPYLPAVAEVVFYTFLFTLFLFPLWYRRTVIGRKVKRTKTLQFVYTVEKSTSLE